ncbi:MAG: hypothetical protein P8J87_00290, partial [Verrucomicrobiales bacterium]|nr:hypothetical protein [Verrucomicrobiales bacterium]
MRSAWLVCFVGVLGTASGADVGDEVLAGTQRFLFDPRLEGVFETIDPAVAGWESEVYQDAAMEQLHVLGGLLDEKVGGIGSGDVVGLVGEEFRSRGLRPGVLKEVYADGAVVVRRGGFEGEEKVVGLEEVLAPLV